jgi:hypothetical protein
MNVAQMLQDSIRTVTKAWTKQRKAEERRLRSRSSRAYIYSDRVNFTDVLDEILEAGYQKASGNGHYTVDLRQFYYQCRDPLFKKTGRQVNANYFSQTLIVKYKNQHPEKTAHWKLAASPRGIITLPHTKVIIPCGTVEVERYLSTRQRHNQWDDLNIILPTKWPSLAEGHRFRGVVFIEKEGFHEMLEEAKIGERLDLAFITTKGQSVTAARHFVDMICRRYGGIPLFIVHDFDPYGLSIAQRLTSVSDYARENDLVKYEFRNEINVIDLGLRLEDVREHDLDSEDFEFRGLPDDTIATDEEREFFKGGQRVELNAFTAPDFIQWLEGKLEEHLPEKFVPADDVLESAWRRALAVAEINQAINLTRNKAIESAKKAKIPKNLRRELAKSEKPWDLALYELVWKNK